jgi:hypothetical protein
MSFVLMFFTSAEGLASLISLHFSFANSDTTGISEAFGISYRRDEASLSVPVAVCSPSSKSESSSSEDWSSSLS